VKLQRAAVITLAVALPLAGGLTACSNSSGGSSGNASSSVSSLTLWDGWTQYDATSPWGTLIAACEKQTGITIQRTSDAEIATKLLQAASSHSAPDLAILDNPSVAQFAETGLLIDNSVSGLDTSAVMPNVLAAGQVGGKTYGSSMGANTLALFYNTGMFTAAGLTPPTTWAELESDAAALSKGDVKGIGFSALGTEEGTFQFLPFFWGAGAKLKDIASPEAVKALQFWTDLVSKGYASQSNLNANQQDIRDQFMAGKLGMMVNGTWQLTTLDGAGTPYAVVPIPGVDGGTAPSPLGGEFIQVVKSDAGHPAAAAKFAQCVIKPENLKGWTDGQSYIMPYASAAADQATAKPALKPWVTAVSSAQGRTADLGSAYPNTSKALWTAIQESLSGVKQPKPALDAAAASLS
jgi:multiple sugar transport system substrate-binding protein